MKRQLKGLFSNKCLHFHGERRNNLVLNSGKDDALKEKDMALITMQQKFTMLKSTNIKLMQDLQNERMRAAMIHDTLMAVCCAQNVNQNNMLYFIFFQFSTSIL